MGRLTDLQMATDTELTLRMHEEGRFEVDWLLTYHLGMAQNYLQFRLDVSMQQMTMTIHFWVQHFVTFGVATPFSSMLPWVALRQRRLGRW